MGASSSVCSLQDPPIELFLLVLGFMNHDWRGRTELFAVCRTWSSKSASEKTVRDIQNFLQFFGCSHSSIYHNFPHTCLFFKLVEIFMPIC
jgi:hypothetical protein